MIEDISYFKLRYFETKNPVYCKQAKILEDAYIRKQKGRINV